MLQIIFFSFTLLFPFVSIVPQTHSGEAFLYRTTAVVGMLHKYLKIQSYLQSNQFFRELKMGCIYFEKKVNKSISQNILKRLKYSVTLKP